MKISKKQLRRIIKEEKQRILKEGTAGSAFGWGFQSFRPNATPDFAKAYGRGAKTLGPTHLRRELATLTTTQPPRKAKQVAPPRQLLPEQGETLIGETPSELEESIAMAMQELFEDAIGAETYQGTGPGWNQEISSAGFEYYRAIIDSGAAKMLLELFADVEEGLHNGDYA